MTDYGTQHRREFIDATWPHNSLEAKRERALKFLGPKWVLHRSHAVKRKDKPAILVAVR